MLYRIATRGKQAFIEGKVVLNQDEPFANWKLSHKLSPVSFQKADPVAYIVGDMTEAVTLLQSRYAMIIKFVDDHVLLSKGLWEWWWLNLQWKPTNEREEAHAKRVRFMDAESWRRFPGYENVSGIIGNAFLPEPSKVNALVRSIHQLPDTIVIDRYRLPKLAEKLGAIIREEKKQ